VSALVAVAASIAVGAAWIGLSIATGLIFHFMPAAPMLVAVWVRRALGTRMALSWSTIAPLVMVGLVVTLVAVLAIVQAGGAVDEAWQVALVSVVGAGITVWLGRRSPA
jgi:hypothetical protein